MKSRLAMYKYPRWIEFISELPKTATGKIERFKLRALANDALANEMSSKRPFQHKPAAKVNGNSGPSSAS
jgi:hypothetical protein